MIAYTGIDVSTHNGKIDWSKVKYAIDFAIIRAGYGANHIDARAKENVAGCIENIIPFGLYWFSYALSAEDARKEADYICDFADTHKPAYPIAFDWEYDSDKYAETQGIKVTNNLRKEMATAFLSRVTQRGYTPMLYVNPDYLQYKGLNNIPVKHYTWLASWTVDRPLKYKHDIWQFTSKGEVQGIAGHVDLNYCYVDDSEFLCSTKNIDKDAFIEDFKQLYNKYFR